MKLIHLTNTEGKSPARSVKELKPSLGSSLKRSSQVKSSCPSCDSGASWMAAEVSVVLLIDESSEVERIVNSAGYRSFTSPEDFKSYIWSAILGLSTVQK